MVLIRVDLPRPVWPRRCHKKQSSAIVSCGRASRSRGGIRSSRLTNADDVELEASLEQLALNLGGDAVETDMAIGVDGLSGHGVVVMVVCLGGWSWEAVEGS